MDVPFYKLQVVPIVTLNSNYCFVICKFRGTFALGAIRKPVRDRSHIKVLCWAWVTVTRICRNVCCRPGHHSPWFCKKGVRAFLKWKKWEVIWYLVASEPRLVSVLHLLLGDALFSVENDWCRNLSKMSSLINFDWKNGVDLGRSEIIWFHHWWRPSVRSRRIGPVHEGPRFEFYYRKFCVVSLARHVPGTSWWTALGLGQLRLLIIE